MKQKGANSAFYGLHQVKVRQTDQFVIECSELARQIGTEAISDYHQNKITVIKDFRGYTYQANLRAANLT